MKEGPSDGRASTASSRALSASVSHKVPPASTCVSGLLDAPAFNYNVRASAARVRGPMVRQHLPGSKANLSSQDAVSAFLAAGVTQSTDLASASWETGNSFSRATERGKDDKEQ